MIIKCENMNKIILLIIPFLLFSCSENKEIQNENKFLKMQTEKENWFPYSKNYQINLSWKDDSSWKNTLELIFSTTNQLNISIDKKEQIKDLKWLWNYKFSWLIFDIYDENIFWKELLNYLTWNKWDILTFNIKNENIKEFEISDKKKEIFRSLDFKTKNIFVNWKEIFN